MGGYGKETKRKRVNPNGIHKQHWFQLILASLVVILDTFKSVFIEDSIYVRALPNEPFACTMTTSQESN